MKNFACAIWLVAGCITALFFSSVPGLAASFPASEIDTVSDSTEAGGAMGWQSRPEYVQFRRPLPKDPKCTKRCSDANIRCHARPNQPYLPTPASCGALDHRCQWCDRKYRACNTACPAVYRDRGRILR